METDGFTHGNKPCLLSSIWRHRTSHNAFLQYNTKYLTSKIFPCLHIQCYTTAVQNIQIDTPLKFSHFVSLNHPSLQNKHKTRERLLHTGTGLEWGCCFNILLCRAKAPGDALISLEDWEMLYREMQNPPMGKNVKTKIFGDYRVIHNKAENFLLMSALSNWCWNLSQLAFSLV